MSEKKSTVFSIRTRKALKEVEIQAIGEASETPKPSKIDEGTVKILEDALQLAKDGKIAGVCMLAMDSDGDFFRWVLMPLSQMPDKAAMVFLGALGLLSEDLRFIAYENYTPLSQMFADAEGEGDE